MGFCISREQEQYDDSTSDSMETLQAINEISEADSVCEVCVFVDDAMKLCDSCKATLKLIRDTASGSD